MEVWNYIRNIFERKNVEKPSYSRPSYDFGRNDGNNFDNSIWENNSNDFDIESRFFKGNGHFHIFSNPLEMTRYFESQIDNMLKTFMFGFGNGGNHMNTFPSAPHESKNLRDAFLKPKNDRDHPKLDLDLDETVTPDNFFNIWEDSVKPKIEPQEPRIFGKFIRKQYVRKPDGTIEEKQIIRNSDGTEEIVVSQQIGDKVHKIVTKKDRNGIESRTEDVYDREPEEMKVSLFNDKTNFPNTDMNFFSWEKLFKPWPKL